MNSNEATDPKGPVPFLQEKRILLTAALVLLADQLTKLIVINAIDTSQQVIVIEGFLKFVNWHNTGAAWSLFSGYPKALAALGILALLLLYFFRNALQLKLPPSQWSFGLIIGGILGNLIDRFRLGHVTDFLDFHAAGWHFPSFNVADSAITIGVGMHILFSFRQSESESKTES